MATRRTLSDLSRKTRRSRRQRGPGADKYSPSRAHTSGRRRFRGTGIGRICILTTDGRLLEDEHE
eukprot:9695369-Lingulodinium_polyedra.AAC.1